MATPALDNVRVLTHSAIRIEAQSGAVIYFDPFQLVEEPHDADAIFITHDHYDHLSPQDVAKVANKSTVVVVPQSCVESANDKLGAESTVKIVAMAPGESREVAGLSVEAVHAYNVQTERLQFHPQANDWLGYVVTVDGVRYYVSGDTDQNPDNEKVSCDVALIPIGGTYTMDPAQAAAFVNAIRPQAVVPTHYGSAVGPKDAVDAFVPLVDSSIPVVIKMEWPQTR